MNNKKHKTLCHLPVVILGYFDKIIHWYFFDNDLARITDTDWSNWSPSVNIKETKDDYQLEVSAPGLSKKDFNISVDNDILTISGEKEVNKNDDQDNYTRKEFSVSSFKRSFTLPESLDSNGIKAEYNDGILNIILPKKEETKEKPSRVIKIS